MRLGIADFCLLHTGATEAISLAGDWRFEIAGANSEQCPAALTQKIQLPGTIDDARLGPPNTNPPTLEGPWRLSDYAGPAWYQRDIDVPATWSDQRVTLFLERCRWVTTVWLDDKRIGSQDSLIAPLNAFWESKGFITPEAFRRFCNSTVPLLRMPKRTYTNAETLEATVQVAHYGAADLANTQPVWKITDAQGRETAAGKLQSLTVPTGKVTDLGAIKTSLANIKTPGKFTVTVSLEGTQYVNDWEIWVYPETSTPVPPADVLLCNTWIEAKAGLAAGKKVIFFPGVTNPAHSMAGSYLPVFWSPVWFPSQKPKTMGLLCDPKHPLFAQFPTEMHSNWQWYRLMQPSRVFILDDTPPDYRPLVQVIDNFERNHKLGVVFETRVGSGQLLVCGLNVMNPKKKDPATQQFLAGLYNYVDSANFKPTGEINSATLETIFAAAPEKPSESKR